MQKRLNLQNAQNAQNAQKLFAAQKQQNKQPNKKMGRRPK